MLRCKASNVHKSSHKHILVAKQECVNKSESLLYTELLENMQLWVCTFQPVEMLHRQFLDVCVYTRAYLAIDI